MGDVLFLNLFRLGLGGRRGYCMAIHGQDFEEEGALILWVVVDNK